MTTRPKILVVDDDLNIQEILGHALAPLGHEVVCACTVPEAIQRLKEGPFGVVLLDLLLPGLDGLEFLRHLREQEVPSEVIVLTAYASLESASQALRLGAFDYLSKPFDLSRLRSVVTQAMEKYELRARLESIYQMGRQIALFCDLASIVEEVQKFAMRAGSWDCFCIWVMDSTEQKLRWVGGYRETVPSPDVISLHEENPIARAARTGEVVYVSETQNAPYSFFGPETFRSILAIPLQQEQRVTGVLAIAGRKTDAFGPGDRKLCLTLAQQIAGALERARLYREVENRLNELTFLNQAIQTLNASLDLSAVLTILLEETRGRLAADAAFILLYDPEIDRLRFAAVTGRNAERLVGCEMPMDTGIAGWVFREQKPVLVPNAQEDPRFYRYVNELTGMVTRSLLAIPLICKTRAIGVLAVIDEDVGAFDERHLSLLMALAGPAAIAIENARLYEETSHLLAETQVLQEVTLAAASTLELDQLLSRVLQTIRHTLSLDYLAFALPDELGNKLVIHPSRIGFAIPSEIPLHFSPEANVLERVFVRGEPELVEDLGENHPFFAETPEMRSLVALPVKIHDERVVAVLVIGKPHPAAFTRKEIRILKRIASHLGIVMESARLYEAERALRQLVEKSRAMLILNERLATAGRLAASLAHEINNPLQVIHNSLQLMLYFPLKPEEQREYLQIALEEVQRLRGLVSRVLDFTRFPSQKRKLTRVDELLEKVLRLCGKYLQHQNVIVQRNFTAPPPIPAVPDELSQVFLNLILNAVDAMPGGGTISISTGLTDDGQVTVSFTDTGRGIPEKDLERIFEPFFTTKEGGTGLGLSLSRDIVRRMGGDIVVRSAEGQGATFTVLLPIFPKEGG